MADKLLEDVLGPAGAAALERAVAARPALAGGVRPRAALAWARVALERGYGGPAPGAAGVTVLAKGESWEVTNDAGRGVGGVGAPGLAAVLTALAGGPAGAVPRGKTMLRLGENLDKLAKAEFMGGRRKVVLPGLAKAAPPVQLGTAKSGVPIMSARPDRGAPPTVRIATRDAAGEEIPVVSNHGDYAVHPGKYRGWYDITHRPSGLGVSTGYSKQQAQAIAGHLAQHAAGVPGTLGSIDPEGFKKIVGVKADLHDYIFPPKTQKAELTKAATPGAPKPPAAPKGGVERPGPPAAARPPIPPQGPAPPTTGGAGKAPATPKPPKPPAVKSEPKVYLTKAELARPCGACGRPQLSAMGLTGCPCHDLSKAEVVPDADGYAVRFPASEREAFVTFVEAVRGR